MNAKFVQDGKVLDITAGSAAINAGDIVISGGIVGVAKSDIPANGAGAIATEGVYDIVKKSDVAFGFGDAVYWNAESGYAQGSAASCAQIGTAVAAAGSGAAVVKVKIG